MKKFIDFLKQDIHRNIPEPSHILANNNNDKVDFPSLETSRADTFAAVSGCLHAGISANTIRISTNDANKFSEKVTQLAYSEEFLNEFSNEIGLPKEGESEEEFVMRAKNKMKNLLKVKLEK